MICLVALLLAAPDVNPPRVDHEPPTAVDADGNWRLWFAVRDESPLFGAAVYIAADGKQWRSHNPVQVAPGWLEVVVPAQTGLRYFFEVFDMHGNGPTRVGSEEVPFRLATPKGILAVKRPWDPEVIVPNPVVPKTLAWWRRPPPKEALWAVAGVTGLSLAGWATWAIARRKPVSKVTLVPIAGGALP